MKLLYPVLLAATLICKSSEMQGLPSGIADDSPLPRVEFNRARRALVKYPANAPNKFYKIPDSVRIIGRRAFENCKKLEKIQLPSKILFIGDSAFKGCENLSSINLPASIRIIEKEAFSDCKNLKSVILPKQIKTIPQRCFLSSGLETITLPDSVETIKEFSFSNTKLKKITIPASVKTIEDSAFAGCKKLKSVSFLYGVSAIGMSAFSGSGLKKVILPDSITNIGGSVFSFCTDLEEISFSKKTTVLEWAVCANCDNLRKVSVSPELSIIKGRAFYDCKKLTEINLPKTIVSVEKGAFSGSPIAEKMEKITLETFTIPGLYVKFNWNFTLDNYRSQGFNVRYIGKGGTVQEYRLSDGVVSMECFINEGKTTPFCFVISGLWAKKIFTEDIMKVLKDPDKKKNFIRTKVFDADDFNQGRSNYMAVVLSSYPFKILIHTDRNGNGQLVIYHVNDDRDEIYYRMLHHKE